MPEPAAVPEQRQLVVSFETPAPEADAAAVAETLRAVVALLNAAIHEVKSDARFALKARAPSAGSLNVYLEWIGAAAILVGANLPIITEALNLAKAYFEFRLLGKGKHDSQSESKSPINITNNTGTINLLLNSQVNITVGDAANAIEADPTIKSVSVLQGEERTAIIKIDREHLAYLKYDEKVPTIDVPAKRTQLIKKASLLVRTPDLLGEAKWAFNYKGVRIEATIKDDKFLTTVRSGKQSFKAGTEIIADMTAEEEFDPVTSAYVPKSYTIDKVHRLTEQKFFSDNPKRETPMTPRKTQGKGKGKSGRKKK